MKILEIVPQLSSGGGERFVVDLCNELSKRHEVELMVFMDLDKYGFYLGELSERVKVISMHKHLGPDPKLPFRIRREIKRFGADVVHTHLLAVLYTALSALLLRRVVYGVHTVHSAADKEACFFVSRTVRRFLFRRGLMTPVTISAESHRSFVDFYSMDAPMIFNGRDIPKNIEVSPEVKAEIDSYRPRQGARVLVNLARLMEVKRQPLIARVCRRLTDEGYEFAMLMIGRPASEVFLEQVKSVDCRNVHLLGERKNPLEYLAEADAYCLMSSFEGMPISLIEGLGAGSVAVCTPVGGIVDVVEDGKNGFLATDLSEDACYAAMKRFLDTPDEELLQMKRAARASYQPFSMRECAAKYEALFAANLRK